MSRNNLSRREVGLTKTELANQSNKENDENDDKCSRRKFGGVKISNKNVALLVGAERRRRIRKTSDHNICDEGRRSFGTVIQAQQQQQPGSARKRSERVWDPSPSKKPREVVIEAGDENACSAWTRGKEEEDEDDDEVVQTAPPTAVTCSSMPTFSDLNNSFTEKISNLDLGNNTGDRNRHNNRSNNRTTTKNTIHSRDDNEWLYTKEIVEYWRKVERSHRVKHNYMHQQKEVSHKMRTILVDWIVEVAIEYSIHTATVHRGVFFVDRFLSKLQISRNNLQLLGTTCLFIACKVEEVHPPDTSDLVYITDNTYTKEQLLRMECLVLSVLDFDLLTPTSYEFADYFSTVLELTPTARLFSLYAIELAMLDGPTFLEFLPSVVALAACYVAVRCCGGDSSSTSSTVPEFLERLQPAFDVANTVESVVAHLFVAVLRAGSCNPTQQQDPPNSVCAKYRRFQEQRFFVAAASAAACFPVPWHKSLLIA